MAEYIPRVPSRFDLLEARIVLLVALGATVLIRPP